MIRGIAWLEQKADHEWHIPVAEAAGFDVVVVCHDAPSPVDMFCGESASASCSWVWP